MPPLAPPRPRPFRQVSLFRKEAVCRSWVRLAASRRGSRMLTIVNEIERLEHGIGSPLSQFPGFRAFGPQVAE